MKQPLLILATVLVVTSATQASTVFSEEFDGTIGYNSDSTTAVIGDNDWVDFANRITTDFNGSEGYATASGGGSETVLAGAAGNNDPQVRSDFEPGFDKTLVDGLELRLRVDVDNNSAYDDALVAANLSVFWGTSPYATPGAANQTAPNNQYNFNFGAPTTLVPESDGWHVATWVLTPGSLTQGVGDTVRSLRIDPVNGITGASFELDYFRVSAVPEPSALALLGIGGALALVARRNRRS
jgi:hypothetical protein